MNFKKLDESFTCINCNKSVKPLNYSSRNHCPFCLHSLHVDILPGDRLNDCKGILKPIEIEQNKKGIVIIFKCDKCGKLVKNIMANDDDYNQIIKLSKHENVE